MTSGASATPSAISIASERLHASISPLGAELIRLATADGADLQWDGDPAVWSGRAPILFPVIGELRNGEYRYDGATYPMPKHGFARHSNFEVIAQTASSATFQLAASAETRAIYPFEFQLDVVFRLDGSALAISAIITNHGETSLPASFGFHPAFRWPLPFGASRGAHRLIFPEDEPEPIRRIDTAGLLTPAPRPTPVIGNALALHDELFIDDALIFDRLASRSVHYGAGDGRGLKVDFADFPTLGVWTKPGAGFLCIEPWHGFSDPEGFDGDIRDKPGSFQITPGDTRTLTATITVEL